jgi:ceramide glucosyltransferase
MRESTAGKSSKSIRTTVPIGSSSCYSAAVLIVFYILVLLELALGVYSLWTGIEWFQMVRRRLASHAGFYAPVAAVICPCKGMEPGLEENLTALTRFEYANYELYFSLATSLDPALKIIERVKAASLHPVHIVIAGPPSDCGEKVYNLRRAVESLPEKFEVLVFTDSDVRLSRGWLSKLVAPLQNPNVGATTTYRWFIPTGTGSRGFAASLASVWNASIATMLGKPSENFCWGGGTAIRRKTFDDAKVLEFWNGAVSDDFAITNALAQIGKPIIFCPECLAVTLHPWIPADLLEFTNRQILVTRVYSPRRWRMGAIAHLSYSLILIFACCAVLFAMIDGDPWSQLALLTLAIPLLAALKGALRTLAITDLLKEWRGRLNEWIWIYTVYAPLVPFLFAWNFISSLLTRQIRWRGMRYELVSASVTRVLKR